MTQPAPLSPVDLHDDHVIALLRSGAHAALLIAYFGEHEYRELSQLAKLAATRRNRRGRIVFILPGVMGSRLARVQRGSTHLLWLHPHAIGVGGLLELALPGSRAIRPVGVMLPGYLKLRLSLEIAGFRPVFHSFDWRLDLDRLARAFVRTIEQSGVRKVCVVAHSMGGLVARAALAHDKRSHIRRLLQLGTPNEGSYAPLQALRAVYPTVRKIASLDHTHSAEALARSVFLTLPGLYQMLPTAAAGESIDLFDVRQWPNDSMKPNEGLLARARRLRARLPAADDRCCTFIGVNQETIMAASLRNGSFHYEVRRGGDGTVPAPRAEWSGAQTWYVEENHGALTQNNAVLAAVADLLREGATDRLSTDRPVASNEVVRHVTDAELRAQATGKVHWESLSLESRRRLLEPVISPEFAASPP
jgi:pimeloyl-ACP methyl ester carboxylesterase